MTKNRRRSDIIAVIAITVISAVIFISPNIFDKIYKITRVIDPFGLDELIVVCFVLVIGLFWYSWRRMKDAESALALREIAEKKLQKTYSSLQETQEQLIQAGKVEAVSQLASGVAHEVRNSLGVVVQGINYFEHITPPEQKDSVETLAIMKDGIGRADRIIDSLLHFSRPKKVVLKTENINEVLEASLLLIDHKIKLADVEVIKELKEDLPSIMLDKDQIEQVFVNMFLNAVSAMPDGGKLYVRSYSKTFEKPHMGVGVRSDDLYKIGEKAVLVEIEDTGVGISEENLKKVFGAFFTTKGSMGGTGLGLAITRKIMDMHKGLVEVESKLGKGTKFTMTFKMQGG